MERDSTIENMFPDFTQIGHLLDMRLTPDEALEYVFRSPFKLILHEERSDSEPSFEFETVT